MKKISLIFLLVISAFVSRAQNNVFDEKQAITMLKNFYTAYLTDIATTTPATLSDLQKKLESLRKQYCTQSVLINLQKLDSDFDADPIIKAQDVNPTSIKTLSVVKNPKGQNSYIVSYYYVDFYSHKKQTTTINLNVVKQKDGFKIASILLETRGYPDHI